MFRIDRPAREVERLVAEAMHATGIPDRRIGRDEDGRLEGVEKSLSATASIVVDVEELPGREVCYVSVVGRYDPRSRIPGLFGRISPDVTDEFREELHRLAGDDLRDAGAARRDL